MDYQHQANILLEQQKQDWDLLRINHKGLAKVRTRQYAFNGFTIHMQFNPERIRSSGAKVDKKSIEDRPCFLCKNNRPPEQQQVVYKDTYDILCNPFPIFDQHYTIAKMDHSPQLIKQNFKDILSLSKDLPDLAVFYNGPLCGASAPDHFHFQAGNRGLMPIEVEHAVLADTYGKILYKHEDTVVHAINDGLRTFISIESFNLDMISRVFHTTYGLLDVDVDEDEPMMNILSWWNEDRWRILIFLREKHRPRQYFEEGEGNILFSPAAVDLGGTLIIPLQKDFDKLTREEIGDMFRQISLSAEHFETVITALTHKLRNT